MSGVSRSAHQVRSWWVLKSDLSWQLLIPERPECKRCVNYGAECVYPVKKAFDPAAVDAALGSRHNRPSKVAATAVAYQDIEASPPGYSNASPPTGPPVSAVRNQPPRADQRNSLADLPPMEMVHALFRNTKMGSYFNNPGVSPPEFLQHAFPNAEDLRCVSASNDSSDSSSTIA